MEPFVVHQGSVALMDRADVDTDQIIPKQFLKRIERTGFGQFLFYDWRFLDDGSDNPEFELNQPEVKDSTILVARRNFGCGSSREHAVWAIQDYGFRVVIAPSFADIFYNNCFKNGILPVALSASEVDQIMELGKNSNLTLTVDLEKQTVSDGQAFQASFEIAPFRKECLLKGLDDIALTLQHADEIAAYEDNRGLQPIE